MMDIRTINDSSVAAVAKFMSRIKPDWWDYDDAYRQLQDVSLLATLVGWYLQNDTGVKGWILCAEYKGYSCLGIENLGYDDNGDFVMEEPLEPLLMRAETYARVIKLRLHIPMSVRPRCHKAGSGAPSASPAAMPCNPPQKGFPLLFLLSRRLPFLPNGRTIAAILCTLLWHMLLRTAF